MYDASKRRWQERCCAHTLPPDPAVEVRFCALESWPGVGRAERSNREAPSPGSTTSTRSIIILKKGEKMFLAFELSKFSGIFANVAVLKSSGTVGKPTWPGVRCCEMAYSTSTSAQAGGWPATGTR